MKNIWESIGAELVISGVAEFTTTKNKLLGNMYSNSISLTLKAISCSNGKIIHSESVSGTYPHISKSVGAQEVVKKVISESFIDGFMIKVLDSFQDEKNNGVELKLMAFGVTNYVKYKQMKSYLSSVDIFNTVIKRNWDRQKGSCEFTCQSSLNNIEQILEKIEITSSDQIDVDIENFTTSSITIRMK